MVSALAALLIAAEPALTVQEVYHLITGYADKVGPYTYDARGWSRELGYGRINAGRALQAVGAATGPAERKESRDR